VQSQVIRSTQGALQHHHEHPIRQQDKSHGDDTLHRSRTHDEKRPRVRDLDETAGWVD